ncbi:MAG: tryptophan--tRNA ligase [Gemmatimonadaceae bacterium]
MGRIFSGIQPSGELHIGNYLGAIKNWVELQHRYECIFCVVNYHAITAPYDPDDLRRRTHEMALSLIASGLEPERCILFVQSMVPEHTELCWIFNAVTPVGELERQTQYKEKAQRQESVAVGLLTYPVLQAADILLYRADLVPVGEDQVQHLELSREVARRWNARYAPNDAYFPEPQALLTATRRIMGLDGAAKMSKSLGNAVGVLEEPAAVWEKLRPAVTDPKRVRRTDPGTPEVCNIYNLHRAFSPPETVEHVADQCSTAGWGCLDCKRVLFDSMQRELEPARERARGLRERPERVTEILHDGAARCRTMARETLGEVKARMGLA